MIIYHTHEKLSDPLIKELYDNFATGEYFYNNIYTTFAKSYYKHFPDKIENFYHKNLSKILTKLGLSGRIVINDTKWCQIYTGSYGGNHPSHQHYSGMELFSWVHFVDVPTDQKCFYFEDSLGNKQYPDTQNSGDLIVFPSWAIHGCDPLLKSKARRSIVAGNINCIKYKDIIDPQFPPSEDNPAVFHISSEMNDEEIKTIWTIHNPGIVGRKKLLTTSFNGTS